jgi:hypothetical protein
LGSLRSQRPAFESLELVRTQAPRHRNILCRSQAFGGNAVAEGAHKNWRELCDAALEAKDPDELLNILQELNKVLKRDEQVCRDFRHAMKANKSSGEIRS